MALTQVKTSGIADDAVTLAKQAGGTDGQIITYDASGNPVAVGPGSDGQVLTSTGAGSPPAFESIPASGIASLVADTSPQLGGDLDVNGQDIVSTSNADIDIIPNGTGNVNLDADTIRVGDNNADVAITTQGTGDLTLSTNGGTNSGTIEIEDGANNDIVLTPNGSGDVILDGLKYPQADGSADQVLKTDGSAQLSWATISGGVSSDAQLNTLGGTNAGDSFDGTNAAENTLYGYDAGTAITTGDYNTFIGSKCKTCTSANTYIIISSC